MYELSYSFHLGSDKNRKRTSRSNGKNNVSNTTSLSNNAIQNKQQLAKVDKHNYRKYDGDVENVCIVKGSTSVYDDVEELYKLEFEQSRLEYNSKQSRPSRMIDNYFDNISKNEKKDLACEIIIELGDKAFWETKGIEYKKKMINVYAKQVVDLENLVPNFKVASAIIHFDETSPHLHIVGVPIKDKNKNGMTKQVGKSDVFTKDSLTKLQDTMRKLCIDEFNVEYGSENTLKKKQKGRNKDIHVKDMVDYQDIKKELDINKSSINKINKRLQELNNTAKELDDIFNSLTHSNINTYKITKRNKDKLQKYIGEMKLFNDEFEKLVNLSISLDSINSQLKYQQKSNKELKQLKEELINKVNYLDKENNGLKNSEELYKSIIEYHKNAKLDLISLIGSNSDKPYYKNVARDLYDKGIISKSEYKVSLKPLLNYSRKDIDSAIKNINREMNESAEKFYSDNNYEI